MGGMEINVSFGKLLGAHAAHTELIYRVLALLGMFYF
jgi:nicotinamide mononucleotide adenylyltransferase